MNRPEVPDLPLPRPHRPPQTFTTRFIALLVTLLAAVLTALFLTGPVHAADLTETEPNNTLATADSLPLGDTMTGSMDSTVWYEYDFFGVTLPQAGLTRIDFQFPAGLTSAQVYGLTVYDSGGGVIHSYDVVASDSNGARLKALDMYLPAGRFSIRISGQNTWDSWGKDYSLTVTHTPGAVETESNDTRALADALPLGATYSGSMLSNSWYEYDFYGVNLPSDGRMVVDVGFPAGLFSATAYEAHLMDASGRTLHAFTLRSADADGSRLRSTALYFPAGQYYLRLTGQNTWDSWGKTYTVRVTHTPGVVETEPNDTRTAADSLPLGVAYTGSSSGTSWYDDDYYAVDLDAAARVSLSLTFPAGLTGASSYVVGVYDADGRRTHEFPLGPAAANGVALAAQAVQLPAGRSYIAIRGQDTWATWGKPYTLKVSPYAAPPVRFSDVGSGDWFYAPVNWMVGREITTGYSDGTFRPHRPVSRGEAVAFLYRYVDEDFTVPGSSGLKDVPPGHNFFEPISWATQNGVVTGYSDHTFRSGTNMTRGQVAAVLYRQADPDYTAPATSQLKDVVKGQTNFYEAISWMVHEEITTGRANGTFDPGANVTRAEFATFLQRYDGVVN
ncbi:S-layer homology domain-containing protein [Microbacterium sp. A93]|uniref:S-layer homology domain-containing protein n=1 Tax=Microbacterium sp. A93 TaxID=3450716 RepID=UPI003F4417B3